MALHWKINNSPVSSILVLWVTVVFICRVENSPVSSNKEIDAVLWPAVDVGSLAYFRFKRASDEESNQFYAIDKNVARIKENVDEISPTSQISDSGSISEESETSSQVFEELVKSKENHKYQKFGTNDFKTVNNKVTLDTKYLVINDSENDRHKSGLYGPTAMKLNNLNKKELNFNSSSGDHSVKTNITFNSKRPDYIIKKKKGKLDIETSEQFNVSRPFSNVMKVNDTNLMNDQPVEAEKNITQNATEVADEDVLEHVLQNTTGTLESNGTSSSAVGRMIPEEDFDILVISGIVLGIFVTIGIVAGGGFIVYRHRMWNKPQTLSDKCSNADSSGYIDDSTLRENSEEMYSLDNDSFLNSLEAMTIQNYWTDNVKHTKL